MKKHVSGHSTCNEKPRYNNRARLQCSDTCFRIEMRSDHLPSSDAGLLGFCYDFKVRTNTGCTGGKLIYKLSQFDKDLLAWGSLRLQQDTCGSYRQLRVFRDSRNGESRLRLLCKPGK